MKDPTRLYADGAKGACYVDIERLDDEVVALEVGWSCVVVCDQKIPVSWLSELVAIATAHEGGIKGFLGEHNYGNPSYALLCNPNQPGR